MDSMCSTTPHHRDFSPWLDDKMYWEWALSSDPHLRWERAVSITSQNIIVKLGDEVRLGYDVQMEDSCYHTWCVRHGYSIIMLASASGWPWRPADPSMVFAMLTSFVLMCHTWILYPCGGRLWSLTMEASRPHHGASHIDILGFHVSHIICFDVSHMDNASSWWPASEADLGGQQTPPWWFPCWYHWFWCVTHG